MLVSGRQGGLEGGVRAKRAGRRARRGRGGLGWKRGPWLNCLGFRRRAGYKEL